MSQRFTVQISDQLNAWLEEQARLNHRSKNKQIEHLLELAKKEAQTRRSLKEEKWAAQMGR